MQALGIEGMRYNTRAWYGMAWYGMEGNGKVEEYNVWHGREWKV